jgi:hypothetical protein
MKASVSGTELLQTDRKTDRVISIDVCKSPCFRPLADSHSHVLFLDIVDFPTILAVLRGGASWHVGERIELRDRGLGEKIERCKRDARL